MFSSGGPVLYARCSTKYLKIVFINLEKKESPRPHGRVNRMIEKVCFVHFMNVWLLVVTVVKYFIEHIHDRLWVKFSQR